MVAARLAFPILTIAAIITTLVFESLSLFSPWRSPRNIISVVYLVFAVIAAALHFRLAYSMFGKGFDTETYAIDKEESDKIDNVILRRQYQANVGHPEYIVTYGQNDSESGYIPNQEGIDSNLVIHLGDAIYRYERNASKETMSLGSLSNANVEDRRSYVSGPMVAYSNSSLNLIGSQSRPNVKNKIQSVSNTSLRTADSLASSQSSFFGRSNGAVTEAVVVCEYNGLQKNATSNSIDRSDQRKAQSSGEAATANKNKRQSSKLNNQRENIPKNNTNNEGVRVISNKVQNQERNTAVSEVATSNYAVCHSRGSLNALGSKDSLVDQVEKQRTSSRDGTLEFQGVRKANSKSSLVDQWRSGNSSESLHSTKRRASRDSNASNHLVTSDGVGYNQGQAITNTLSTNDQAAIYEPLMSTPISDNSNVPLSEYPDHNMKKFSDFINQGKYNTQPSSTNNPSSSNQPEITQPVNVVASTSKPVESVINAQHRDKNERPLSADVVNLRHDAKQKQGNVVIAPSIGVGQQPRASDTYSVVSNASLEMPWLGNGGGQRDSIYCNPDTATLRNARDRFKLADRLYNDLKKMHKIEEDAVIAVIKEYKDIIPVLGEKHQNLRGKVYCRIARVYYNYLKKEEIAGKYAQNSLQLAPENSQSEVWYKEAQDILRKVKRKEEWQDSIKRNRLSKLSDTADTKYYYTS
ncbi:uncharacterized protein TRIADDRAFT_58178 [Trichoplax adhaerens]|uniref:Uncharacterized protein n=1 Tax=Trichoplax adhaerens TaxID=10228 RepID=B3S132_TRIAD|nr:hypothetical protein TRIADDRAFT_58178 [Trichoplax adhaerens]EDV23167.1 hypothetical protein TRIADDRAFT_58178 [Trichoplax adhaerens]|eukprot:XP_002114077.1 hypothetical protein TRIADDRAFT_58178 [Trichoplax adhaerens]